MAFLIYAYDHEGMDKKRESIRQAHREHLSSVGNKLIASGALLDDDKTIVGGISLLNVNSREEAEKFANEDPYVKAGIRKTTKIIMWRKRWFEGEFLGE